MNMLVLLALLNGPPSYGFHEILPAAMGPINCPEPPATIRTAEGRIYECRPEEGQDPYVDVTPPDDQTHWRLPFGSTVPPPRGTGSYHPPEDWHFRSIIVRNNPAVPGFEYFYVFDQHGVVIESNLPHAIGDQMMEIRTSGIRIWPTANVYYLMPPLSATAEQRMLRSAGRTGDPGRYALVVDGKMLCPALDESYISDWPLPRASPSPFRKSLNGHCGDAYRTPSRFPEDDARNPRYYAYPGFKAGGLDLRWSFQRHDEPERPILNRKGECVALCTQGTPRARD
ncbi:hypothetical protein [Stenotrophomonas sp. 24(2023)]|uniref:hypothetical protein n=1 Tax=Stenotrophomonas sp. 24(2023) TaxID=3068324 RepID=UPI0027DF0AA7|nr:hypothetical protein [Stenotrophomonas sp. 24(2023)]WMJ70891.1 hypothetical protein Q9R17_07285 [Stenotrophomonas sp. 24(2023)]